LQNDAIDRTASGVVADMLVRSATREDAVGMSLVLGAIAQFTGRPRATDVASVIERYLDYPSLIRCSVAVGDAGEILGFQSLILAAQDNPYAVPPGWGIIGTHISPEVHRQGIGAALFRASRAAALNAGIQKIDAYIAADNVGALAYYEAMGFRTYREPDGIVQKLLVLV
jgi:ribosomal protein S18 acetylase RimI-like enzyme